MSREQKVEETRSTGRRQEEPSVWDGRGPSIPHSFLQVDTGLLPLILDPASEERIIPESGPSSDVSEG